MNKYNDEIWVLITRELSGEATLAEQVDLRKWLDEDPKRKEFYRNIESSWTKDPEDFVETFFFDYESGLGKLRSKLDEEPPFPLNRRTSESRFSAKYVWIITAVFLLVVSLSFFMGQHVLDQPVDTRSYVTSDVEQRIITLSDGSVVRLNRNSEMEVEVFNEAPVRSVRLEGEAFFDVAENRDRPFVIHTDEAVIEVLGTSFNVKQGSGVMVAVQEGIVSLRHKNHEEKSAARLVEGQLGLLSQNGSDVKIEETNIENYMGWMNGYLRFSSMPFSQVLKQLERIYGVQHKLQDPLIGSVLLTVYTDQIQKEQVFTSIALALDFTYFEQEGVIHWQRQERRNIN